jgi:hypothetical protein
MVLAGLFGTLLFLALIAADWWYFFGRSAEAVRYGCPLASFQDPLVWPKDDLRRRFDAQGQLRLKHGVARLFPEERLILLRSRHGLEPSRFRTAWPMKASLQWAADGMPDGAMCIKRMPWSSALLTSLWFLIVGIGTAAFVVIYLREGGLASLSGILMGLGILGIGLLVLAFGLVTIAFAYRLENHRLTQVYDELRAEIERS